MNISILKYFSLALIFAGTLIGCGSSDVEMTLSDEEIIQDELDNKEPGGQALEDQLKSHDKTSDNSDSSSPLKKTSEETKFSNLQTTQKTFAVQIAAFKDEENARQFIETNKDLLKNYGVYYKNQDDLFKILIGSFASVDQAGIRLQEIFSLGYNDTFVLELQPAKK